MVTAGEARWGARKEAVVKVVKSGQLGGHGKESAAHQTSLRSVLICLQPSDMTDFTSS